MAKAWSFYSVPHHWTLWFFLIVTVMCRPCVECPCRASCLYSSCSAECFKVFEQGALQKRLNLSVTEGVFLPGTQTWHASCAQSVMVRDSLTKWQFPPINCASFLSFNLRHAINCDLLRLGTCLGLRWEAVHWKMWRSWLDSQNGRRFQAGRQLGTQILIQFDVSRAIAAVSLSYLFL